ncbi:HNH endonuclease signature motif containing protein [Geodermatophilus sp. DSM 45219]|uniref:HNH endonuclease signature motif containing protein n=1 Tax=Geodermatophilus sp. DSM 45219 TaxID=1881103 RepID=UPI002101BF0D|nr:HNH endonuclease signature motif containing protein [Geodermatophilus sp. DSM 45219]
MDDGAQTSTLGAVVAPTVGWASGPLGAVQAAAREIARLTAVQARAVAAFAASRPASVDRQQGERGAMSAERWAARAEVLRAVSEWATAELAIAVNLTQQAAEALLSESLTLVHRLPGTLAALERGVVHRGHLWHLIDKVAPVADAGLRAEIEADLLAWLARRNRVTSPAQLGDKARRVVARRDAAAAARRLAKAIQERGVYLRPERAEGMAAVTVVCTMPEARALHAALSSYADALADEDGGARRTRGQRMVDALVDLVLRPGETELPPVRVLLGVVASMGTLLGGDAPGEVDGQLIPAEMVRQLVHGLAGRGVVLPDHEARALADAADAADAADPAEAGQPAGVAWQEAEQAELGAWWDQVEARLLAGGLEEPDWPPEDLSGQRWTDTAGALDPDPLDPDALPPDGADGRERRGDPGGAPDIQPPASGSGTPPERCPADGWWAAADRAVEDAGAAVHAAGLALGHARRSVRTAQAAAAAQEAGWRAGPGGRVDAAPDALTALAAAADGQRQALAELLAATAGGGLADRPRIVLADAVTGAFRTLTDLPALRRAGHCGAAACRRAPDACGHDLTGRPGLRGAGPTGAYRPGAALDRHVRARDRRCRFPGCRRPVTWAGELDHARPHAAGGPTSAANLAGYCTGDHRGKHQAPGWTHTLGPDGTLTVTTPTGLTAVTEPPPY